MKTKRGKLSLAAALAHAINQTLDVDVRLGNDPYFSITRVPTGSLVMDRITGGGFALGRHVEIYGDEQACKSYIAYKTLALSQERGNLCALVDPERTFDRAWFEHLGGQPTMLLTYQPETAEEAVAVMMTLAKYAADKKVEIIAIDSVASLIPFEEAERDPREEDRIAAQARMMSRALRRITSVNRKTLFLWTNQERQNIAVRFGNPRTTPGGRALRFYASTRIEMRKGGNVTAKRKMAKSFKKVEAEIKVGRWIQLRAEKEKTARPFRQGSFIWDGERGEIDLASEIIQLGLEDDLIERSGNSLFYTDLDDYEWKGTETRFRNFIRANEELRNELTAVIKDNTVRQATVGGSDDEADSEDL
jgi:recombination protein RecA